MTTTQELTYALHGSGAPNLLLIHGWLTSRSVWSELLPELDSVGPILIPDLHGCGETSGEPDASIETHVGDLLGLLDRLEVERIAIAGHSMGGAIAQQLAARAPERVSKLILVAPVPASGFPLPAEVYQHFDSLGGCREALEDFFTGQVGDLASRSLLVKLALKVKPAAASATLKAWTSCDFGEQLADISAPTLVVAAGKDFYLTPELLQRTVVDPIEGAQLRVLESAGHYVSLDSPRALAETFRDHLS